MYGSIYFYTMITNLNVAKMTTLQEISTHKAIHENGVINIYAKGMIWDVNELAPDGSKLWEGCELKKYPEWFTDELLWTIPYNERDDLFAIFERLEEDNRIGLAELNEEILEEIKS